MPTVNSWDSESCTGKSTSTSGCSYHPACSRWSSQQFQQGSSHEEGELEDGIQLVVLLPKTSCRNLSVFVGTSGHSSSVHLPWVDKHSPSFGGHPWQDSWHIDAPSPRSIELPARNASFAAQPGPWSAVKNSNVGYVRNAMGFWRHRQAIDPNASATAGWTARVQSFHPGSGDLLLTFFRPRTCYSPAHGCPER